MEIITLQEERIDKIVAGFKALGWPGKDRAQYKRYISEGQKESRVTLVALIDEEFAGYGTIIWSSSYIGFKDRKIPEIQDLNVLPQFRRKGVATELMDRLEAIVLERSTQIGIGVGLYSDYGPAQRMYVKRGYIPDGKGITYDYEYVPGGADKRVDDDLVLWFIKKAS